VAEARPAITLAPSPVSAAEDAAEPIRLTRPPGRGGNSWTDLWREAAGVLWQRGLETALTHWRETDIYRLTLRGPITDRIAYHPLDLRPPSLDDADDYFGNRFRFAGQMVDAKDQCIFDIDPPTKGFAAALHGFEWLRHLEAADGAAARQLAAESAGAWLVRHATYSKPAWQPEIIATRFLNLFAHGNFLFGSADGLWRGKFFASLRNQARVLARTFETAPDGLPRLEAVAALALAGICLRDRRHRQLGFAALSKEIARQILPDGGHLSRSPEAQLEAYRLLSMVQDVLDAAGRSAQPSLRSALERMAMMLRFFRLGDGSLGVFNGGSESDARLVTALLEGDKSQLRPFAHAADSGYQRVSAGRCVVLMDVGTPAQGLHSTRAHAGFLSLEMSAGGQRLIVNCGAALSQQEHWADALRATAAHSTLTLDDTSAASVLPTGRLREILGPRLLAGNGAVETRRSESPDGIVAEGTHDFYLARFGVVHQRRIGLSPKGTVLSGTDRLIHPKGKAGRRKPVAFAIRFHIHPDIRLSLAQGGGSVILKLPNGEGWRFRCGGGTLAVEESVYVGTGVLRRGEQLVIAGHIRGEDVECAWLLEQIGAG
jgi:uncharacterized heparinase superfamily protein